MDDEAGDNVRTLDVDLAANARSLGAEVFECETHGEFVDAFKKAHETDRTTVVSIANDRYVDVPGYDSWWDVQVAEVSEMDRPFRVGDRIELWSAPCQFQ